MEEGKEKLIALGRTVRAERKLLGLSQEDFAEACDLHRTYVGQIERGEKNISFINILRIAKALKNKPSLLFSKSGY